MALQAPLPPPGLTRPSSWPVRHERRHAAVSTFNAHVTKSLDKLNQRLDDMKLQTVEDKINNLEKKFDMMINQLGHCMQVQPTVDAQCDSLEERINSMEILLLRTSIEDFRSIDKRMICSSGIQAEGKEHKIVQTNCLILMTMRLP
jgi:hypothetical protein